MGARVEAQKVRKTSIHHHSGESSAATFAFLNGTFRKKIGPHRDTPPSRTSDADPAARPEPGRSHRVLGRLQLSGHKLGIGAGHCFLDCGGLSHP